MCWKTKMIWRRLPTGPPFKAISLNVDMIILDTTVYLYRHVSITIWEYAYRKTLYNVYHIICKCIFTAYLKIVVRQTNQSIAQRRTLKTTTKQTEVLPRVVVCNIGRVTTCKVNASEHATKRKQGCGGTSSSTNCSNNKTWHIQVESKKNKCVCKLNIQVSGKSLSQTIILHIISYHSIGSGCMTFHVLWSTYVSIAVVMTRLIWSSLWHVNVYIHSIPVPPKVEMKVKMNGQPWKKNRHIIIRYHCAVNRMGNRHVTCIMYIFIYA